MSNRTLKLSLLADADKFGKGLKDGESRLQRFGGGIKKMAKVAAAGVAAAGALGAGAFALANRVSKAGDEIGKTATKLGVTTDSLQEMRYWADQNGISASSLDRAVGRLNQRVGRAAAGNDKYASAFEHLGVKIHDAQGEIKPTNEVMHETIDALRAIESPAEQSAAAAEVFGTKMARDLMPALQDSSLSLDEAAQRAQELGLVMDEDSVRASERFQDALGDLRGAATGLLHKGAAPLIEFFADQAMPFITKKLIPIIQKFSEWIGPKASAAAQRLTGFATSTLIPTIRNIARWFRNDALPVLRQLRDWIVDNVVPALRRLADWFQTKVLPAARALWDWIAGTLIPGVAAMLMPIIEGLRNALQTIASRFDGNSEAVGKLMSVIRPLATFIAGTVAPIVGTVLGGALTVLGHIIGTVIDVIFALTRGVERVVSWFQRASSQGGVLRKTFQVMTAPIRTVISLIDRIRQVISRVLGPMERFTKVAGGAVSAAKNVASNVTGRVSGALSKIPGLASGGIVTGPTVAMVGEAGPEAVIPLDRLDRHLGDGQPNIITINVTGTMLDPEGVARAVERAMRDSRRRHGGRAA